ncbi:DUF262 domain-containing protein [Clostridium baratii]|uniref:DUF262 domain-containing protein n=1 Tax=Clostridium baratii TaxID=1561 RepID=UPI0030CED702
MKSLESLNSIFQKRIFKIPDYQRGYAWQKKQLIEFWEDIINLPTDRFHYTGLLSLREVSKDEYSNDNWLAERWLINDRGYTPFHIVDGQQRLTTIIIFINEIVEFLKRVPENKEKTEKDIYFGGYSLKEICEDYLVIKKPPEFKINSYKFGYKKDNPSFEYLKYKILEKEVGGDLEETFYTLNLDNAKKFFRDNIENYYSKYGKEGIEELFRKVTQNLMFNLHEIEDNFDVYVAFETMNNRGKKLSNLELLKNRLIYLTTLYDKNEIDNDTRMLLRNDINKAWKEIYMQLGRNKKNPLSDDEYLKAHWIIYFQYKRKKGDDYITFLLDEKFNPKNVFLKEEIIENSIQEVNEIREENELESEEVDEEIIEKVVKRSKLSSSEIFDYVHSLNITAKHWYNSFNPMESNELTNEEKLWIDRLNRIKIAYFRPLVVASFLNKSITSKDRVMLFKEIERFIFIAFKLGRAVSNYRSSEYYGFARKLSKGEATIDEICKTLRDRIEWWLSPSTKFDIKPFRDYISKRYKEGKGFYDWNGLQYLLYEYENEKVLKDGNKKIEWEFFVRSEKDKVSIEHIYPQTPNNYEWIKEFEQYTEEQKNLLGGSLGNLLPLSKSKNSSMQNDSFEKKKRNIEKEHTGYIDGSHSEIEVSMYDKWGAEEILDRGFKLLEFMERRWDIKFENDSAKKELLFLDFI